MTIDHHKTGLSRRIGTGDEFQAIGETANTEILYVVGRDGITQAEIFSRRYMLGYRHRDPLRQGISSIQ